MTLRSKMEEISSLRNVTVGYDSVPVIRDLSLSIQEGDFIGIIGPNGSGKSTLLRILSGVLKPWSGESLLYNTNLSSMKRREISRLIGVVPQESYFAFDFTCLEVVLMGRNPYLRRFQFESQEDYRIAEEAMELTDTLFLKDRLINELSGGERQRVIIARTLAQNPKILLLDEPVSHLDINHQIEILDLMRDLNRKGLTIVAVSHDLNLAGEYCRRLILLDEGRTVASGSPHQILVSDLIESVYHIRPIVEKNPQTGAPLLVLVPGH